MTADEYLKELEALVRERFRPSDETGSMSAAYFGWIAKQAINADHRALGFLKFKDALAPLEQKGVIRTGANSKGAFSIWLLENSGNQPNAVSRKPYSHRPLRNPVWFAFVSETPKGRRFLHQVSGEVRVGESETLGADWIEITPVDPHAEKLAANQFLEKHHLEEHKDVLEALGSPRWFVELPRALGEIDPNIASDWKRSRTERILKVVEVWQRENNLPEVLLFSHPTDNTKRTSYANRSNLRELLLAAIEKLPTSVLLDIPITARVLIQSIKPELLND